MGLARGWPGFGAPQRVWLQDLGSGGISEPQRGPTVGILIISLACGAATEPSVRTSSQMGALAPI